MIKEQIEVYSHATNACVIRMPERKFPGVVIQGDSLSINVALSIELIERLEGKVDDETFLTALRLAELLESALLHYEDVLVHHGIQLPHARDVERDTKRSAKYWAESDEDI
ncbi:MAG: hypothetical protein HUU46_00230 [Candidatus Hydrogenedentes bacterium]|nr:hypothetical protein [Candidatus Hydrogenedentota bacterium]